MGFTLATWKEQAAEQLRRAGEQLARWKERDAPYLVYGGLCGLALWPAVLAAQQGELLPVMAALAGVVGGVGGNLIAEQVQRWKDRADEVEVEAWAAEQAPQNPALREALDAILERLEAIPQAQAGLGEDDRRWLAETLQRELAQLGNLERFQATLHGPGAIAQTGGRAVGPGGVLVEGDVRGDVVTGRKVTYFDQRGQTVGRQTNVAADRDEPKEPGGDG